MAQEVSVIVRDDDRARLEAIVGDRNHSHKHVQRARIVLLSAERLAVAEVARRAGVSRPAVWRWQRRYAEAGAAGLRGRPASVLAGSRLRKKNDRTHPFILARCAGRNPCNRV